jgi:hypothetical protein
MGSRFPVFQQALVVFGIPMPISTAKGGPDGIFLSETRSAVKAFQPGFSKTLETNLASPMYITPHSKDISKHHQAWSESVSQAFEDAPLGARRMSVKGAPLDVDTYRVLLRIWGDNKPGTFSYRFSHQVSTNISNNIEREMFLRAVDKKGCIYNF